MSTTTATVTIRIPTPLRGFTNNQETVEVSGATVGEALQQLVEQFPRLKPHLFNEEGRLRSFVNIYLGDEDIRYLQREETPLKPGAELSIVPSVAGGRL